MRFKLINLDESGRELAVPDHDAEGDLQFYGDAIQLGEQLIRLDLGPRDVHQDAALATLAFGFKQTGFVASETVLTIPVDQMSNKYYQWNKDDVYEEADLINNAPEGDVPEIGPRLSLDSYNVKCYAISTFVRTEVVANADSAIRPRMAAVKRCMNVMQIANEIRKAAPLQNTANFDANLVKTLVSGTSAWFNRTSGAYLGDPIKDLQDLMEASLRPVNRIVMNRSVANVFSRHPNVQKYFQSKAGQPQLPSPDQMQSLFNLPPITVAEARRRVSASSYPYIWGDDVTLLHMPEGQPTGEDVVNLANFRWTGQNSSLSGKVGMEGGFMVRSYFDERRGVLGGEKVIVFVFEDEKIVSKSVGGLIKNAIVAA
jgi:hypothetical protein